MITLEELATDLLALRDLLAKNDFLSHAAVVEEIALLCELEPQAFLQRLDSAELWGSSGSVWDVVFAGSEVPGTPAHLDQQRFRRILLHLARAVAELRGPESVSEQAVRALQAWHDMGLF